MFKKFLLSIVASVLAIGYANAQVDVVFTVENPDSMPVYVFGNWNGWSNWPGYELYPIGNNQYSATVEVPMGVPIEFLFVNGDPANPTKEALDTTGGCGFAWGAGPYDRNRKIDGISSDTMISYIWEECTEATPPIVQTFTVENPDSTPVYLFGSWSDWTNWPGQPMDMVSATQYSTSVILSANYDIEYLYVNGATPEKEVLDPTWTCTNGNGQYTNRVLTTGTMDDSICSQFASCLMCGQEEVDVTFRVQFPSGTPVHVFGSWNNWTDWPGTAMTDLGDDTWEVSMTLPSDVDYEYLYVRESSTDTLKESMDPAGDCTNGNTDFTNRVLELGTDDVVVCNIWETCMDCYPLSVTTIEQDDLSLVINAEGVIINSDVVNVFEGLSIYDVTGRQLYSAQDVKAGTLIPAELQEGVMYLISVQQEGALKTFKAVAH